MAIFPTLANGFSVSQYPYTEADHFYVTQSTLNCGKTYTRSWNPSGAGLKRFVCRFPNVTNAELIVLEAFWDAMNGKLGYFTFTDDAGNIWTQTRFDEDGFTVNYVQPGQWAVDVRLLVFR